MSATERVLGNVAGQQRAKPHPDCVRDAIASVRIEGGQVDEDTIRILNKWADNAFSDDAMMIEILKLYVMQR